MTGAQPDPPRTRCGQMARRRMPAGRHTHGRPAMPRLTAIAACRPRRVAIVHFSTPFWSLACCGDRLDSMPALRRSPDDGPCRPDAAASPRPTRIPADLRGPARQHSLSNRRAARRRLSHAHRCKERASAARGRAHKGARDTARGRHRSPARKVADLKHRLDGAQRAYSRRAWCDKAGSRFGPVCRARSPRVSRDDEANARRRTHEMFHRLYMRPAAGRCGARLGARTVQPTRQWPASSGGVASLPPFSP